MAIFLAGGPGFPEEVWSLLELARDTGQNAYNIYSGGIVGASVETATGIRFQGTFMENASYGLSICAEPAAILAANSAGHRDIARLAIVGGNPSRGENDSPRTPCGRCRQIIWEAARVHGREIEIYCSNLALTSVMLTTSGELLPYAYGGDKVDNAIGILEQGQSVHDV
jgi:cytidine deaminase